MFKEKLTPNFWLIILNHSAYLLALGFILTFVAASNLQILVTTLAMFVGYLVSLYLPWLLFCSGFVLSLSKAYVTSGFGVFLIISLPFFFSRLKGLEVITRFRKKPKKNYMIAQEFFRNGITWTLKNRMFGTVTLDDFNFAAGASKIRFSDYLLGSFLGLALPFFIFPAFGSSVASLILQQNWHYFPKTFLFGIAAFILSFIPLFYRHMEGWGSEQ